MAGQNGIKDHDARLVNGDEMPPEPIAIIGMAMRLPGGIRTASDFWKMLVEKRDTRCRVPADRYNIEAFYSKSGRVGTVKMQYGHFLAEADNLANMDTSFFTMIQTEVENLDPQQRMLLEVVYECLENGGQTSWRGSDIGMYVGVWGEVCQPPSSLLIILLRKK
jgi:acyl transferase domain-containing protein